MLAHAATTRAARLRDLCCLLPLPRDIVSLILPMLNRARETPAGCILTVPGGHRFLTASDWGITLIRGSARIDSMLCSCLKHIGGGVYASIDRLTVSRIVWVENDTIRYVRIRDYQLGKTVGDHVELLDTSNSWPYYVRGRGLKYIDEPISYTVDTSTVPPSITRITIFDPPQHQ